MLMLQHRLLQLRRAEPALSVGSYAPIAENANAFAFSRTHNDTNLVIAANFTAQNTVLHTDQHHIRGAVIFSTLPDILHSAVDGTIELRPDEALIIRSDTTA